MNKPIGKWFLSLHAAQRLQERNVSVQELGEVLNRPDHITKQGNKLIYSKNIKNRNDNMLAAVVLEKKEGLWLVITVMINFQKK